MEIDFDQILKQRNGKPLKRIEPRSQEEKEPTKSQKDLTLALVCADALFATYRGEQVAGKVIHARYKLATRLEKGGKQTVTAEQISEMKKLISKFWNVLVMGQAWDMLEQKKPGKKGT